MSDRMTSIPFGKLMNWVLTEAPSGTIFGVHHRLQADPNRTYTIFDRPLEMPFGPSAGTNTQCQEVIVYQKYEEAVARNYAMVSFS